jgi:hypothetical protein
VGNDGVGKFDILGFEIAREVQLSDINLRYDVITNKGGPIEFFIAGIGRWGQPCLSASGGYQNYEKGVESWVKVSSGCSGSPQCNTVNNNKSSDAGALFIGARHLNDDGCIYSYDIHFTIEIKAEKSGRYSGTQIIAKPIGFVIDARAGGGDGYVKSIEKIDYISRNVCIGNEYINIFESNLSVTTAGPSSYAKSNISVSVNKIDNKTLCSK